MRILRVVILIIVIAMEFGCSKSASKSGVEFPDCENQNISSYFANEKPAYGRYILYSDLRDVERYYSEEFPQSAVLMDAITKEDYGLIPDSVGFLEKGPEKSRQRLQVYGVEINSCPAVSESTVTFSLQMIYSDKSNKLFFRRFTIGIDRGSHQVVSVHKIDEVLLENLELELSVALVERKLIISSGGHPYKIYPLDVGGFDEGVRTEGVKLMTPLYEGAYLNKALAIESRATPSYFKSRPFLRISHEKNSWSPIGFHIEQGGKLHRGFESHGCMRLREKDLYELYWLLQHSSGSIPVEMEYFSGVSWDHPKPLRMDTFNTVSAPFRRDKHGLTVMHRRYGEPPVERLGPLPQ